MEQGVTIMKKDGPGIWFSIHVMALMAVNKQLSISASQYIRHIIYRLRGSLCRENAVNYLKIDPPDDHLKNLFEWTVHFHNSVNKRLGKKEWTVLQARNEYMNPKLINNNKCIS